MRKLIGYCILSAAIVAMAYTLYTQRALHTPGAEKGEIALPEQQVRFCSIIENGRAKYYDLLHRWSAANDQKNGIVTTQLSHEMTAAYRSRNEDIFTLLSQNQFSFENWLMTVVEVASPINGLVGLKIHPFCSKVVLIHASAPATPAYLELLATKKQGDRFVVSGTFVEKYTRARPTSPEKFEMSLTESGSMDEPEYAVDIKTPSSATSQSNANSTQTDADKETDADKQADADKAAVTKVMKDAVAARHGGKLPATMSAEDAEVAAQAAIKWKKKQAAEKAKRELDSMKIKPPPSNGNAEIYLAKEAIAKLMRDPSSAEFGDVFFVNDRKSATGYYVPVVCGTVNGKNGFGGMTGQKHFVAVMSDIMQGLWLEGTTAQNVFAPEWNRFCAGRHD